MDVTSSPLSGTVDPAAGSLARGLSWRGRGVGEWFALAVAVYLLVNVARAFADPSAFAAYVGLPITGADASGVASTGGREWVLVYASRTLVLAAVAVVLVVMRHRRALGVTLAVAVAAPVTDAVLTSAAGAPGVTVVRHVVTAVVLGVVSASLLVSRRPSS